jgi:hypothetical protein
MNAKSLMLGLGALLLLATGCGNGTRTVQVAVPPRMDLAAYPMVGLVGFSSNAKGELDRISTERFLRALHAAQPGTRVVELGTEQQVLASVNRRSWDRETLRLVSEEHGVDAIVLGRLDVERSKPDVKFSTFVKSLSVKQDVNAELTARLVEAETGATLWTDGAKCTTNLAHASFNDRGHGHFGASDPDEAYGEMVDGLVWRVTDAFRVHYVTRRVPIHNNNAVASAE